MRALLGYKPFAFAALILWLLTSWSGVHGHMCFDGQEPPLSVHMDMLGDHPEHHAEEQHQDADLNPAQLVLAKLLKVDLPFIIAALLFGVVLLANPAVLRWCYTLRYAQGHYGVRPPVRAPPPFPV